jgi:Bacterial lectin
VGTEIMVDTIQTDNILTESFTGSDVTQNTWIFGRSGSSLDPFLTARSGSAPVGGLPGAETAIDTPGSGALRLTNNEEFQSTFVIYDQPINRASGLSINFDLYSYGGTGADGISFFLIDGSANPTTAGAPGGSLGYSSRSREPIGDGIVGGYIGVGFDEFGNFSDPAYGSGGPGLSPDSVVIRGSEATGYKYLTGTTVPSDTSIDNPGDGATRSNSRRNVQIDLTPSGLISVQMDLNNNGTFDENERLISNFDVTAESANNAPLPETFKFGFSASTGGSTNFHEINNFRTNTVTGSYIPLVNVASTDVNTVPEDGSLVITAELDRPTSSEVSVPLTLSGTAVNGVDYTIPTSITIAPNQTTGSVTLTPIDNTTLEPNKTVAIALGTPTNAQLSPQNNTFTVTILDNEAPLEGSFNFENQLRVLVNRGNDLVNLLFDNEYYLANNPDVATAVTNGQISSGFQHFQQFGQFEGRDPSIIFNNSLYLSQNLDVAAAVANGQVRSGFEHFVNFGFPLYEHRDLRMLSFDEGYYLRENQDVFAAVNRGELNSGFEHYLLFGQKEGRNPSLEFNETFYLANNPDVNNAVTQGGFQSGFDHYVRVGIFEGRNPISTFENSQYLSTNPDVVTFVTQGNVRSGTEQAVRNGKYQGRAFLPQLFDEQFYLTQNPDVAADVAQDTLTGGLDHFTLFGQKESRRPSTSYDENFYLTRYSDVANAVTQGVFNSGFEHFILFGRSEGRLGVG